MTLNHTNLRPPEDFNAWRRWTTADAREHKVTIGGIPWDAVADLFSACPIQEVPRQWFQEARKNGYCPIAPSDYALLPLTSLGTLRSILAGASVLHPVMAMNRTNGQYDMILGSTQASILDAVGNTVKAIYLEPVTVQNFLSKYSKTIKV